MLLAGIAVFSVSTVWAQDQTANDQNATSETSMTSVNKGLLRDETVGLKPQVGVLDFKDATGNATTRGAIGLAFDLNFSRILSSVSQNLYAGLSTGGLYSHIGDPGSNFFGSSPNISSGTSGANLALFPVNAKLGFNVSDRLRISGHGGGNVIYASIPSALAPEFGSSVSKKWNIFPNAGGDVDFGLSRNVALTLRPDWTFTPGVGFFTGTLELGIALG